MNCDLHRRGLRIGSRPAVTAEVSPERQLLATQTTDKTSRLKNPRLPIEGQIGTACILYTQQCVSLNEPVCFVRTLNQESSFDFDVLTLSQIHVQIHSNVNDGKVP